MWTLRFHDGTLVVEGATPEVLPDGFRYDDRIGWPRGPAWLYPDVVLRARQDQIQTQDNARKYGVLDSLKRLTERTPRPYQAEALDAWRMALRRGTVVLPTGAGKTLVAELCIAEAKRSTMVVAPTLDLVGQWYERLKNAFGVPVGILGGGHHEIQDLTVSTYDSAWMHLPRYGDRFGLLVFDEVHHLPAPAYLVAAQSSIAPFRLGLTATYERPDQAERALLDLVGPVVYRKEITELTGDFLASYETVILTVHLSPEELERYKEARKLFTSFLGQHRIPIGSPNGWQTFLRHASRSRAGRAALKAFQESRRIAHGTERKLDLLAELLAEEHGRPTLIFTNDNATAYKVSREFLAPCITYQTDIAERRALLTGFEEGRIPVLVTSRVLNEGVDLPSAEVAIVLSGTGTVREHVQRLGRILRPGPNKQAVLYELVAADTAEERTSARRRNHEAYQG